MKQVSVYLKVILIYYEKNGILLKNSNITIIEL